MVEFLNYNVLIAEVLDNKKFQWLEKIGLKAEALLISVQKQIRTRPIEAGMYHIRLDSRCRLCKDASETIRYVALEYEAQAGTIE